MSAIRLLSGGELAATECSRRYPVAFAPSRRTSRSSRSASCSPAARSGPTVHPAPLRGAHRGVPGGGGLAWRARPTFAASSGPLARSVDRVLLDIDVGETGSSEDRAGMLLRREQATRARAQVGRLLEFPCPQGLCTADKREALLAYPGYVDEKTARRALAGGASAGFATARRAFPEHLRALAPPRQDLYRPGGPLEAKAYLAGNHHWHTPTSGSSSVRPQKGTPRLVIPEEQRLARARRRGREALASLARRGYPEPLCP